MTEKLNQKRAHNSLRWGVIGCGDVFLHKSGPALQLAPRSEIAAIMRRDPQQLAQIASQFAVASSSTDAAALINDPTLDIIYIATTPASHAQYALQAATAGKHVLIEKPMAMNAAESQRIINACTTNGVELFVAYYRRFWPHLQSIKDLLSAGRIGKPLQAMFDLAAPINHDADSWRLNPAINGGGYFVDLSTHRIDLLVYLFGCPQQIAGAAYYGDSCGNSFGNSFNNSATVTERCATTLLEFTSGVQAVGRSDFESGRRTDRLEIIGSNGQIIVDDLSQHQFTLQDFSSAAASQRHDFTEFPAPHLGLIEHIESVLLDGADNACSGSDGLITDQIVDVVLKR